VAAYQVKLPIFEGPFDLLYHLIEEQKINIYDIPIAAITAQYLDYLHIMEILDMEVASGFLIMAATLLEIKSKMLLPKEKTQDMLTGDDEIDEAALEPDARQELVDKLLEYRRFKVMALQLREMERNASRLYTRALLTDRSPEELLQINLTVLDLLNLYQGLVRRRLNPPLHRVIIDKMGLVERINEIRAILKSGKCEIPFKDLIKDKKDKYDIVLSLLAVLEISKMGEIQIRQSGNFKPIILKTSQDDSESEPVSATG